MCVIVCATKPSTGQLIVYIGEDHACHCSNIQRDCGCADRRYMQQWCNENQIQWENIPNCRQPCDCLKCESYGDGNGNVNGNEKWARIRFENLFSAKNWCSQFIIKKPADLTREELLAKCAKLEAEKIEQKQALEAEIARLRQENENLYTLLYDALEATRRAEEKNKQN
jgi:hypothetical protein